MKNNSIGIIPGHFFTIIYFAKNYVIIEYLYIENTEFLSKITDKLDYFIEKYLRIEKLTFLSLYTGPSPLVTSRTICAWFQGWSFSENLPVVTFFSPEIWQYFKDIPILINLFGNKFLFYDKQSQLILNENEMNEKIKDYSCIGISKGIKIKEELLKNKNQSFYSFFIPKLNIVGIKIYKKFENKEFTEIQEIKPFLEYSNL